MAMSDHTLSSHTRLFLFSKSRMLVHFRSLYSFFLPRFGAGFFFLAHHLTPATVIDRTTWLVVIRLLMLLIEAPSVLKEIVYGISLGLFCGGLWKMHHWNNQRRTREFYDLLEKGDISEWWNKSRMLKFNSLPTAKQCNGENPPGKKQAECNIDGIKVSLANGWQLAKHHHQSFILQPPLQVTIFITESNMILAAK